MKAYEAKTLATVTCDDTMYKIVMDSIKTRVKFKKMFTRISRYELSESLICKLAYEEGYEVYKFHDKDNNLLYTEIRWDNAEKDKDGLVKEIQVEDAVIDNIDWCTDQNNEYSELEENIHYCMENSGLTLEKANQIAEELIYFLETEDFEELKDENGQVDFESAVKLFFNVTDIVDLELAKTLSKFLSDKCF